MDESDKQMVPSPSESPAATETKSAPAPVLTLVDLYTAKGANPAKLLRELDKSTSWRFEERDVNAALALLDEHDAHLQRTRRLLHDAIATHDGRFSRAAADFALRATARDLDGIDDWPPAEGADPIEALGSIARHVAPQLRAPKRRRRAHNTLIISADLLSQRHGLAFEDAAPILRTVVGRPAEYQARRRNPRRHRMASLTDPRNDLERVRDILDLLEPWEAELRTALDGTREASARAQEADDRAATAETLAAEATRRAGQLQAQLDAVRQEATSFRDQARDVRIVASSDATEVRGRTLAFLNTRLRDLLATAKEASEVEPPRTTTALRLMTQAIDEIQQEAEWLRSSA